MQDEMQGLGGLLMLSNLLWHDNSSKGIFPVLSHHTIPTCFLYAISLYVSRASLIFLFLVCFTVKGEVVNTRPSVKQDQHDRRESSSNSNPRAPDIDMSTIVQSHKQPWKAGRLFLLDIEY